ncbi:hypothetical protein, partial [Acinetobacter baumannii]
AASDVYKRQKILFIITAVLSAIFSIWLLARLKPMLATAHLSLED